LENLICGEIHKNRTNNTIKNYLYTINKKEEFKQIAYSNWETEINNFINK
jgi:hypothetical protein